MSKIYPFFTALSIDCSRIVTGRSCITKDNRVYIPEELCGIEYQSEIMPETLICEMKCLEEQTNDLS